MLGILTVQANSRSTGGGGTGIHLKQDQHGLRQLTQVADHGHEALSRLINKRAHTWSYNGFSYILTLKTWSSYIPFHSGNANTPTRNRAGLLGGLSNLFRN